MSDKSTDIHDHEGLYTFKEGKSCMIRTKLEKIFLVLIILLFITAIVFIVLFVFNKNKQSDDGGNVCTSRNCIITAGIMAKKMDTSVNPCHNFAEFACGGFYRDAVIPRDKRRVGSFITLNEENLQITKGIVQEEITPDDPEYLKKIKNFYAQCVDEESIERIGIEPYLKTNLSNDWPTLNPNWSPMSFALKSSMTNYSSHNIMPILASVVTTDMKNSSRYIIYLSQPHSFISLRYLKAARNGSVVMAFQKYYEDFAVALGAEPETAKIDAVTLVDFEVELAKIKMTREETRNASVAYVLKTLSELEAEYPYIDFYEFLNADFSAVGLNIDRDQEVVLYSVKYLQRLKEVLDLTDLRTIQNLFGFSYARNVLGGFTKRLREIYFQFDKVREGTKEETPRWRQCLNRATGNFWKGVSKEFVKKHFAEEAKAYMNRMIDTLENAFSEILDETEWMGDATKEEARLKLKKLGRKIGYPDTDFTEKDINEYYKEITIVEDNYYETLHSIRMSSRKESLKKLFEPVDKTSWTMSLVTVNAFYSPNLNQIGFPAGILQPPFFSQMFTDSVNYGAIGTVIGHEITHGFDDGGAQFDSQGILRNWWQPKDLLEFKNRTHCVIEQYSNFEHPQVKKKLNGIVSAGENIADIGGVKEAFRAYKLYTASRPKEKTLPGLGLTPDQQFFLAFSQLWCQKLRDRSLRNTILNGVHSPGLFRIIGALQNSEYFSKAFDCPAGSYMNPVKKCVVW